VITPYIGGGFGGKSNTSVELFVVRLAMKARGRPDRLVLTREEEFRLSFTRMAMAHI
jgi:CO/xanthine dehydrogenase Mo-binding subunit